MNTVVMGFTNWTYPLSGKAAAMNGSKSAMTDSLKGSKGMTADSVKRSKGMATDSLKGPKSAAADGRKVSKGTETHGRKKPGAAETEEPEEAKGPSAGGGKKSKAAADGEPKGAEKKASNGAKRPKLTGSDGSKGKKDNKDKKDKKEKGADSPKGNKRFRKQHAPKDESEKNESSDTGFATDGTSEETGEGNTRGAGDRNERVPGNHSGMGNDIFPENLRQAVIWAEILGPPAGRKNRKKRMERLHGYRSNAGRR